MESFATTSVTMNYFVSSSLSGPQYGVQPVDYSDAFFNDILNVQAACGGWLPLRLVHAYYLVGKTVERFRSLPEGWDGPDSLPPSLKQIEQAKFALLAMLKGRLPVPKTMLLNDGTVGAYWNRDQWYASFDFEADGDHPWVVMHGDSHWSGMWNCSQDIPPILIEALGLQTR